MEITADRVKELRETTGLGMMTCKKALTDANGDMNLAIENLRKEGQATAAKRASKAAKEGKVSIAIDDSAAIAYEVNSETDFVARNTDFQQFTADLGTLLLSKKPSTLEEALELNMGGATVKAKVLELVARIGENISFRRFRVLKYNKANQKVFTYIHGNGKIGVMVLLTAQNPASLANQSVADAGKDVAMQVAAANPLAVRRENFSESLIAKEKEIYFSQAQQSGRPENVWPKIVDGKLAKFYKDNALVEQIYIKDDKISVTDRLKQAEKDAGSTLIVEEFVRFELGAEEAQA